jgi:hypothetical protein
MVPWRVIFVAAVILGIFLSLPYLLSGFLKVPVKEFISPTAYYLIVTAAILLGISAFLPFDWGRILRSIVYLTLFLGILLIEIPVMNQFIKEKPVVSMEECKKFFFPEEEKPIFYALGMASCIFTGYYPVDFTFVGVTTFFIFYFLLPLIFIGYYIYGLMVGTGIRGWFGAAGETVVRVFSVIIALYAARVMFGAFLLSFLAYGAWGLAGVFGAIFLVKGLETLINKWYAVEREMFEARGMIERIMSLERGAAENLIKLLRDRIGERKWFQEEMIRPGTTVYEGAFKYLPANLRGQIEAIVRDPALNARQKRERILELLRGA